MNPSVLRSVREVLTGPTAMFITATTTATICATVISVSLASADKPAAEAECPELAAPAPEALDARVQTLPTKAVEIVRVPRVRQVKAKIDGDLDRDVIRRVVRAHINEVRYCYNQGLERDSELRGRVSIQFTIAEEGSVEESVVAQRTLPDEEVATCIANAVSSWTFPSSGDGMTVVTYPFALTPG